MKRKTLWISFGMAACAILTVAATSFRMRQATAARHSFEPLVEKLRSGEIAAGDSVGEAVGLGKPRLEEYRRDENERTYIMSTHQWGRQILHLYTYDESLFAAQLIEWGMGHDQSETWFFYDADLFNKYIALAQKEQETP